MMAWLGTTSSHADRREKPRARWLILGTSFSRPNSAVLTQAFAPAWRAAHYWPICWYLSLPESAVETYIPYFEEKHCASFGSD